MKLYVFMVFFLLLSCSNNQPSESRSYSVNGLESKELAKTWDEGIPLGNGIIGALIWKKDENLRLSLDHVELWDLRPTENLQGDKFKWAWVYEQWENKNYKAVQESFDKPYDDLPAPSKIPGAGLEFEISEFGKVSGSSLDISDAVCQVNWDNGTAFSSFVHATDHVGWFRFKGVPNAFRPVLLPPAYISSEDSGLGTSLTGQDLRRLGYSEGEVEEKDNTITYIQEGWGGFSYQVAVTWNQEGDELEGCWSISAHFPEGKNTTQADKLLDEKMKIGYDRALKSHQAWWLDFWSKSMVKVPDSILQRQWLMEKYKFGSAARADAPPISLQAVWTADHGKLPPWKGDFHHDLNTQLSYWPAYSGNHLDLEIGFINWMTKYKQTFEKYTKTYFGVNGLNVPGVTTLTGEPMGGWIQYSLGPTVGAWLGHHYYLHWRYSMDKKFLRDEAYPWIKEVAVFFDEIAVVGEDGKKKLLISSSPEIYDNSAKAWFAQTTNYDLSMIRWTYEKAAELALELNLTEEATHWTESLEAWPQLAVDQETGLMFSPDVTYHESHRHFSHLVGFHPLGIVDFSNGEKDKQIIEKTLKNLSEIGSDYWTGYSFSWQANLQARAFDGNGAVESLRTFSENFVLPNSFHVNGEQHNRGYSKFKYRPFTLEGNFAFASGLQEMLIQSHTGAVHLFPAIPDDWKDVSFDQLRAEGAFLVSAELNNGKVIHVDIKAEKGGVLNLMDPFDGSEFESDAEYQKEGDLLIFQTHENQIIQLR